MNLEALSDADLDAYIDGNLEAMSDEGLDIVIAIESAQAEVPAEKGESPSGLARGLADPVTGLSQMLYNVLPEGVQEFGENIQGGLHSMAPSVFKPANTEGYNAQLAQEEAAYQQARAAAGEDGIDWGRIGGNIVSPVNLAAGAGLASKLGTGYKAATGIGAGTAAMQPVYGDEYWKQKALQTGLGAATGMATQGVANAVGRVISPNRAPDVRALHKQGISPTIGSTLGGPIKSTESKLTSMPILGNAVEAGQNRSFDQLTTAAYNRVLGPIGEKMPKGLKGGEAITHLEKTLGKAYDDVVPKLKGGFDNTFNTELATLQQYAQRMTSDNLRRFERVLKDDVMDKVTSYGRFSGETWKKIESNLGHEYRKFAKSLDPKDQEYAQIIRELQASLRRLQGRINPRYAKRLADINRGWAGYDLVARASTYKGPLERGGQLSPANLSSAMKAKDFSINKRGTAKGDALMQEELIGPAMRVMGGGYPDSGTGGRMFMNAALLGAAGGGAPAAAPGVAGLAAASLPFMPGIQGALSRAAMARPPGSQAVSQGLKGIAPFIVPGMNPVVQGILDPRQ